MGMEVTKREEQSSQKRAESAPRADVSDQRAHRLSSSQTALTDTLGAVDDHELGTANR